MGFLSDAANTPDADAPAPKYGGFLSDNPPPETKEEKPPAPAWSDIPTAALANAPESGWNYLKNMYHGITNLPGTLRALGQAQRSGLEERLAEKPPEGGYTDEHVASAIKQQFVDRYGSEENFRRTLAGDPIGVAGDFSAALMPLGGLPGRAGRVAGAVSTALDPLTVPTAALKGAGKAASATLGLETGVGMRPIEEAAKAGYEGGQAQRAFEANRTGEMGGQELVEQARNAVNQLRVERGRAYEQGMIPVKQSNQVLNWNDVGQAIRDAHNVQEFHGQELLDPAGAKMRNMLDDKIINWMQLPQNPYHTAEGFDALKKAIGHIKDAQEVGSPEHKIASAYYNAVRNTIAKQVPEYSRAMEGYSEASNLIKEIEKTLSLPANERRGTIDTSLRKLQSVLRRNVNTNYGQRDRLVDFLEASGAPHLRAALAGQALQSYEPHGLGRVLPLLIAAKSGSAGEAAGLAAMSSPRAVGYLANRAGMLARPAKYLPPKSLQASQLIGRWTPEQARGGKVTLRGASNPRPTDAKYQLPKTLEAPDFPQQARGGKIARALRAAKAARGTP